VERAHGAARQGRDAHLAGLRDAFERSLLGPPRDRLRPAAAGTGKTALVRSFSTARAAPEAVCLIGAARARVVPFKALDSLCRHRSRGTSAASRARESAVLPENIHALGRLFTSCAASRRSRARRRRRGARPRELRAARSAR